MHKTCVHYTCVTCIYCIVHCVEMRVQLEGEAYFARGKPLCGYYSRAGTIQGNTVFVFQGFVYRIFLLGGRKSVIGNIVCGILKSIHVQLYSESRCNFLLILQSKFLTSHTCTCSSSLQRHSIRCSCLQIFNVPTQHDGGIGTNK